MVLRPSLCPFSGIEGEREDLGERRRQKTFSRSGNQAKKTTAAAARSNQPGFKVGGGEKEPLSLISPPPRGRRKSKKATPPPFSRRVSDKFLTTFLETAKKQMNILSRLSRNWTTAVRQYFSTANCRMTLKLSRSFPEG